MQTPTDEKERTKQAKKKEKKEIPCADRRDKTAEKNK